jgi:hypothetical protein
LRLLGEAYCVFVGLLAVGSGLFVWFTGQKLGAALGPLLPTLFPGVSDDSTFMGGIEFVASGWLVALAVLIVSYAMSQALTLLVRSTRNGTQQPPSNEVIPSYRSRFGS